MSDHKWCAIDAEGDVGNKGLLGVAFYSDKSQHYLTNHDLIKELLTAYAEEGYTFLAHNAQYDLSVIFWQLHIPMKAVYYNGRFNHGEWRVHSSQKLTHLWDTLSLSGNLSLARLGKAIGTPKYNTPQRLLGLDPDRYEWRCDIHQEWECETCYAIRDAEIVYRFVVDLENTLAGWGVNIHHRISGLSVAVWKALDHPTDIQLHDYKTRQLARKAYHGGRVETFKLGTVGTTYTADVCSMYPSVMVSTPYPNPQYAVRLDSPTLDSIDWNMEGVAEVDITVPSMYVPPLPYQHRGLIKYPIGRFRGYWTFGEIRYAQSLGCKVNQVFQAAFSTRNLYPFTNFVSTLWSMREAYESTKDPRTLFAKLLMNNLYGRLGTAEKMERRDIFPADPNTTLAKQHKTGWYTKDGELYLTNERDISHGNQWTNVLWAAQTTAYARIKLHQCLLMQGNSLLYCDTDSVFSTSPIVGLGEGLGSLRDPHEYEKAVISAPKLYAILRYESDMPPEWSLERCTAHHEVCCYECRWVAKAKGVPQRLAYKFLRTGVVTSQQPIKPYGQGQRKVKAGTWVDVKKENQYAPSRRHPVNPDALYTDYGWSDTVPDVVGPIL